MKQTLYDRAEKKVTRIFGRHSEAYDFCLADWPEGDEHLQWLLDADADELRSWTEASGKRDVRAGHRA